MTKYYKGYNGRIRKIKRTLTRMQAMYRRGTTFNELWPVFEPIQSIHHDTPEDSTVQAKWDDALAVLHKAADDDYREELLSEYWASVL